MDSDLSGKNITQIFLIFVPGASTENIVSKLFKAGFYLNVVKKRDFSFSLKLETLTIKVYIAKSFGRVFAIF